MFKRQLKSQKMNLPHLNGVWYTFKQYIIQHNIQDEEKYLQLMLKNYLVQPEIIQPEQIQEAKEFIIAHNQKELNEQTESTTTT